MMSFGQRIDPVKSRAPASSRWVMRREAVGRGQLFHLLDQPATPGSGAWGSAARRCGN